MWTPHARSGQYHPLEIGLLCGHAAGRDRRAPGVANKSGANMMTKLKIQLAQNAAGRIALHLGCLLRGGRWNFHWTGVRREVDRLF